MCMIVLYFSTGLFIYCHHNLYVNPYKTFEMADVVNKKWSFLVCFLSQLSHFVIFTKRFGQYKASISLLSSSWPTSLRRPSVELELNKIESHETRHVPSLFFQTTPNTGIQSVRRSLPGPTYVLATHYCLSFCPSQC